MLNSSELPRITLKNPIFPNELGFPFIYSNCFIYKKVTGFTGSIVRRRMKNFPLYWHYAFIYGFDQQKRLLLIENNKQGDVKCIFWEEFIDGCQKWEFVHIETSDSNFHKIISKAIERAKYKYHPNKNNCEHFVNYCVFEKLESFQVETTKRLVNIVVQMIECRFIIMNDPIVTKFIGKLDQIRSVLEIPRGNIELDNLIKEKLKYQIKETPIMLKKPKFRNFSIATPSSS